MRILVVEDDSSLNLLVGSYLKDAGYETKLCSNPIEALEAMSENSYDMIISDIMMPKMDGFEFATKVRSENNTIPFLFMSAKDDKPSKQYGYKIGVDDYIVKPFDIDDLLMRVGAILRRIKINEIRELVVGNLVMNKDEHCAYVGDEPLQLTVREFDLLFKLLSSPKKTFTRSKLMDEFWDYDSSATSRTVDVYMAKLREKTSLCEGFEIVTVHGLGYKAVIKCKKIRAVIFHSLVQSYFS